MKKTIDKIALVALIIIGFIGIALAIIFPMLATGWIFGTNDVLFITLAVLYTGVSIYLLWSVFSSEGNVKTLTLFSDKESTTKTSLRVIKSLVIADARRVKGASVKRVRVSQRESGVRLNIKLAVVGAEVEETVDTMRCLVADTFIKVLGIRFDIIDFKIEKVRPNYMADEATARKRAQILKNERKCSDKYHDEAMDPIFEHAEKERDLAEEEKARQITQEKEDKEQAEIEEKEEKNSGQNAAENAEKEETSNSPQQEQAGQEPQEQPQEQEPQESGEKVKEHNGQKNAKGKRGGKIPKISPPSIEAVTVSRELPSSYDDGAEKVAPREAEALNAPQEDERTPPTKVVESGDFTISDDKEEDKDK